MASITCQFKCSVSIFIDGFEVDAFGQEVLKGESQIAYKFLFLPEMGIVDSQAKVSTVVDVAWQNSSLQIFICFHHFFVPFRGFEPHPRRNCFMKFDIQWAFFYILIH